VFVVWLHARDSTDCGSRGKSYHPKYIWRDILVSDKEIHPAKNGYLAFVITGEPGGGVEEEWRPPQLYRKAILIAESSFQAMFQASYIRRWDLVDW